MLSRALCTIETMDLPYICSSCLQNVRRQAVGRGLGRIRGERRAFIRTLHITIRRQQSRNINSSRAGHRPPPLDPVFRDRGVGKNPHRHRSSILHERPVEENKADFDAIAKLLDEPRHDVVKIYDMFMRYMHRTLLYKQMLFKLHVIQHSLPRRILQRIIEVQHTVDNLPSPENLLTTYGALEIDNELHWADVMFDYLRKEQEADVITLWAQYQRRLETHNQMLVSDATFANLNPHFSSSNDRKGPAATSYPITAALTAHLNFQHKDLITPTLNDLLHVLDQKFALEGSQIPAPSDVSIILAQYKVPKEMIARIMNTLQDIRPYASKEEEADPKLLTAIDAIYLTASTRDIHKLTELYKKETTPEPGIPNVGKVGKSKTPTPKKVLRPIMYQAFINSFMQCRDTLSAYNVWNDMVNNMKGKPPIKMWGALLDGCAKTGNVALFERTWKKLEQSGIKPDSVCWTMRMQLYFVAREPQMAKHILLQMEKKAVVTTYTINAAITGLDNLRLYADSFTLIQWATKKFNGTIGDTITFNLIIRSQVKQGHFAEAQRTLALMSEVGIKPDIITYSEIINGMYMYSNEPPPIEMIHVIVEEMRTTSIKPNLHFYNTVIYGLLTRFKDLEAARAVLDIMPDQSWRYSAITSNMFIQFHLMRHEFDAVDAIWFQMKRQGVVVDPAVYNVTIKGYAMASRKERMLYWFGEMLSVKKHPSIATYIWVLRCLAEHNDLSTASEVVTEVLRKGSEWQRHPDLRTIISELVNKGMLVKMNVNPGFGRLMTNMRS